MMFNDLIKLYRKRKGLTQEELAELLNVSTNHLSRIERKIVNPSGSMIKRVINVISHDTDLSLNNENDYKFNTIVVLLRVYYLDDAKAMKIFDELMLQLDKFENCK